jgi:hypothetical protein
MGAGSHSVVAGYPASWLAESSGIIHKQGDPVNPEQMPPLDFVIGFFLSKQLLPAGKQIRG